MEFLVQNAQSDDKKKVTVDELLSLFIKQSGEEFANDRALLA